MVDVTQAHPTLGRARAAARRLMGAAELPVAGAVLLSLLAFLEVTGSVSSSGPAEPGLGGKPVLPGPEQVNEGPPEVAFLLALLATVPIAFVRSRLVVVAVAVALANTLTLLGGYFPTAAATIALGLLSYLVARHRAHRAWLLLLLPFVVLLIFAFGAVGDHRDAAVLMLFAVSIAGVVGTTVRAGEDATARRASEESLAGSLLENAAKGERARIARELHDVVAHHISMISVQAETARLTTPGMPPDGAKQLSAIGDTAREALSEMRRLLGVLRDDADALPTRSPQPGLHDLADLVDDARATAGGTSTRLVVRGPVRPLEPGLELTAYRIVQEALTNARRHAPGAAVDVELDYAEASLCIRVRDNGPGRSTHEKLADGHGLLGMRERAVMVGGEIRFESGGSSGFLVEATLPADRVADS
jgi:signal transduction histidine kinase